ncbi:MAG TPA: hypothetical protein VK897_07440 [Anaerolineales bacterium]|nr:hypothetical protein [Anaerolineales bacterium]
MLQRRLSLTRTLIFVLSIWLFLGAFIEFERIAWGTGVSLGQFSLKWALALLLFGLFCILCLIAIGTTLWSPQRFEKGFESLSTFRERLSPVRVVFAVLFLAFPVYILQYTFWGKVLHGPYLRILLAVFSSILLGWVLTKEGRSLISWPAVLTSLVLITAMYNLFVPLAEVTSYPFSLAWSEGNRLWDYSILFGRHLYNYPPDQPIPVLLETGRQFVGAIPFLYSDVNIWQVRLWLALVDIIPYLLLGWAAFRLDKNNAVRWFLAGVWAFAFVRQGPVHPPLLLCAIVVALARGRPLWIALPLIAITSYFAEVTRFTWLFAPGLWAAMLELSRPTVASSQVDKKAWTRAISVGLAGVFGGYIAPFWIPSLIRWASTIGETTVAVAPTVVSGGGVTVATVTASVSVQPLLWSRLLPNATYGEGILLGLALATLPLIIILIYLARTGRWQLNLWQRLAIVLPMLAFLVVGLIVSVKIGGGGDLHNLDMFIIGLMFAGAIAWRSGAYTWIDTSQTAPVWIQFTLLLLIALPGYKSLMLLSPLRITEDITTVARLADIVEDPLPNPLPDTLPSEPDTAKALSQLQGAVAQASQTGEVLFMDQRQLLTFGYVSDTPLVPEYDKKVLINEAMSANAQYFAGFYQDLASQRFSLIVTNPVNRRLDRSEGHFAEENNAWVTWVSTPLLCYYEPLDRLKRVDIELLVPRKGISASACDDILPIKQSE